MALKNHTISVINFTNQDTVTYSIIKLIGNIQNATSALCQNNDNNVHLIINNVKVTTNLVNNKFKFLVELHRGQNRLIINYCCEEKEIVLVYSSPKGYHSVIPLYVICDGHDGNFQAPAWMKNTAESACKRISLCSKLLQCVTAEKLNEHGLGRKTFSLESDCQIFQSRLNYLEVRTMSQAELWENIGREIMKSPIGSDNKKYLAFLSCTRYLGDKYDASMKTHEDLLNITEGYVALGGGGLALFGSACLYTWPETFEDIIDRFEDEAPVDRTQFLDDSCYRSTLGACFSTTLGSVLHELFHTFDLGHTEDGIMGRGFDNIYKVFTKSDLATDNVLEAKKILRNKIEFKEELEPGSSLAKDNIRKEFTVIEKFEEVDDTLLTRSCAVILCYHKWFNCLPVEQSSVLSFDSSNKLIKSTAGVRVVEIRRIGSEMVLHNWVFDGRIMKFSFQLSEDVIKKCNGVFIIFVEDTMGFILKETINL
ncbi:unnamed protein product [Phaedon cochleariae]|uniref:Zinc metalloproteinase n=1 Tax=Phaedon cochleariae TaxID=80249 RepID=A0A9P0DIP4_PHACE|nr:unnamed protein product [Phaedon cochleariae]